MLPARNQVFHLRRVYKFRMPFLASEQNANAFESIFIVSVLLSMRLGMEIGKIWHWNHHQEFWSLLANHKIFRAVPDDRFGVLKDPTCMNVAFSLSSLCREGGIWRKGKTKFSCSHLAVDISRCLDSCNHLCQREVLFHAIEQEKKGVAQAESKNPYTNLQHGPTCSVISEAQILCFAGFYTGGSDGPTRDQVIYAPSEI